MKHIIEKGMQFPTNSSGVLEIVEQLEKGHFLVRFVETGYTVTAHRGNIVAGKVKDRLQKKDVQDVPMNATIVSNSGLKFTIVSRSGTKCVIVFEETKHTRQVHYANAIQGKVADPYSKTFLGIGYLGEFERESYWKRGKQLWSNMMKRCYNEKDEKGYFGKCFVDPRWHCFGNFLSDIKELENFSGWLSSPESGVVYNLDKDLKIAGSNVYSKESCSFELESLNKGATNRNNYYRGGQ